MTDWWPSLSLDPINAVAAMAAIEYSTMQDDIIIAGIRRRSIGSIRRDLRVTASL